MRRRGRIPARVGEDRRPLLASVTMSPQRCHYVNQEWTKSTAALQQSRFTPSIGASHKKQTST